MKLKVFISIIISVIIVILWVFMYWVHWLYLDNSGFPITETRYLKIIFSTFYTIIQSTSFWYDVSALTSSRFIGHIFLWLSDFILYFIFLVVAFWGTYYLLRIYFSKTSSFFWALLYTLNPVSLLFLNLIWFIFAYTALPIILISIYLLFQWPKYRYILLLILGWYFFISYTRILWIYLVFLFLIGIYYRKEIFHFIHKNKLFTCISFLLILWSFSPFILSIIYPHIDGQGQYFSWLWNYAESSLSASVWMYYEIQNLFFGEKIILRELTSNYAWEFQKNTFFIAYSFLFLFWVFIYAFLIERKDLHRFKVYLSAIALFVIFIIAWPKFLSLEFFSQIAYQYFPFIANNTNWLYVLLIPIYSFLLSYTIEYTKSKNIRYLVICTWCIYSLLCFFPIINHSANPKLQTISIENIPQNYQKTFHQEFSATNPSLFFPATWLYFSWAPYPIDITNNNQYQPLFTNNIRLVNSKQESMVNLMNNSFENIFATNSSIFNLKNIFVFKDIRNIGRGQFDYYPDLDNVTFSQIALNNFRLNKSLYIKQDNENFVQFWLKDDDKYEFYLYAPWSLQRRDLDSFFSDELQILEKPMVIDPESFHKPSIIDTYEVPRENQNITIRYKSSIDDTTKIYAKIANFDNTKPFLLQLNQTFGMSWKVKWITKEQFEEKPCIDEYREYSITQNKVCQFKATLLDLWDTKYLKSPQVSEERHFEGNFVGNTWLITPDDIPSDRKNEKELYAIIIYEKQIWYAWTLVLAWLTFAILVLLSLWEGVRDFRRKKN